MRRRPPWSPVRIGSRLIRRLVAAQIVALLTAILAIPATAPGLAMAVGLAGDDSYGVIAPFVLEDKALAVAAPGVLANDTAGPGESLCIVGPPTSSTQGGTVSLAQDGSFTYTSPADYAGADTFTYGVAAVGVGGSCPVGADDTAVVSLTVTQVNDAPTAQRVGDCAGGVTVSEDSGEYEAPCLTLDPGPPNESSQELSSWLIQAESTLGFASGPTITAAGDLVFRPLANDSGTATLSVRGRDNGGTANGGADTSAAVEITITVSPVPDAPVAVPDTFGALKDRTLNIGSPGVLLNDTDADGDPLTATLVSSPVHGALTLAANGSFSYTPAVGFVGADAFSYRASDGGLSSATRVVSITVSAVPQPTPTPLVSLPPTAEPTVEPSFEVTAEPTVEPTESLDPSASAAASAPPRSPAPSPTAGPRPSPSSGGPGLPLLLVGVLFLVLLVFGGAYYVPRWIRSQRGEPLDPE